MTANKGKKKQEETKEVPQNAPVQVNDQAPELPAKFKGLNRVSVESLMQLGISDEKIISTLQYLKTQKNNTSVGEVDRALDLLDKERKYEEEHYQMQAQSLIYDDGEQIEQAIQLSKLEQVTLIKEKSKEYKT